MSLLFLATQASAAPFLSFAPSPANLTVGDTVALNVNISDAVDVYAFQFDLGFNPSLVGAASIVEGSFLAGGGDTFFVPGNIDNVGGAITFTGNSLVTAIAGVTGSGTLATVTFAGLGQGATSVLLFNIILLDSSLSAIPGVTTSPGNVNVTQRTGPPVPEPATWLLVGAGMSALTLRRRRMRN